MSKKYTTAVAIGLLCCLVLVSVVLAASNSITRMALGSGGGTATSSGGYNVNGIVGQGMVGASSSANYQEWAGFWHGSSVLGDKTYLPSVMKDYTP
jgi:hypothetical protein